MASRHFIALSLNLQELKRIYLDSSLSSFSPTVEQQEMARAFLVFSHAELEWFVERVCFDLDDQIMREATARKFSGATLSLLTFGSLEPVNGGEGLGGKKGARSLSSRVGDAVAKHKSLIEKNDGLREKHLAKLLVPLGLTSDDVDSSWLADLDSLCSSRGAFAHMSRAEGRASHLAVNPTDVWKLCDRLVWGSPSGDGRISSFENLDQWIVDVGQGFAAVTVSSSSDSVWVRMRRLIVKRGQK